MKNIILIIGLIIISTVTFLNAETTEKCSPQLPSQLESKESNSQPDRASGLAGMRNSVDARTGVPNETSLIEARSVTMESEASSLQIPFIKNEGQIKSQEIKFYTKTPIGNVFITDKGELIYNVLSPRDYIGADTMLLPDGSPQPLAYFIKERPITKSKESNSIINVEGLERAETVINSFVGPEENWRSNISTYKLITLGNIWDGITFNLKANQKNIEKLFIVHPNGNVDSIRFAVSAEGGEGVTLSLKESGELELITSQGNTKFTQPIAYQDIDNVRKPIDVSYLIIGSTYGFKVGNYDHSVPLIIDPFLSSTYCGGDGEDVWTGIVRDDNNLVITVGYSNSFNIAYPATFGSFQPSLNVFSYLLYDVIISQFSPGLTSLWSSTYLGSSNCSEYGAAIALDTANPQNIYVTGIINNALTPPTNTFADLNISAATAGVYDGSFNGGIDVFVARLSRLPYSPFTPYYTIDTLDAFTYLGGAVNDYGYAIKVVTITTTNITYVYVAGIAGNSTFPTSGGADATFGGGYDGFVARFNNALTPGAFACSYVGGSSNDFCYGLAVDTAQNVIVTGNTFSSDFPTTTDTYRSSLAGGSDVFITKFSNGLSSIINTTLIGGNGYDVSYAIATDPVNNIYVTGETQSSNFPFSCTALSTYSGAGDVFISKFNSGLTNVLASRFIGGSNRDLGYALVVSATPTTGQVFVFGYTSSTDFPTCPDILPPYSTTLSGNSDAFITRLDSNTLNLEASTYIGGSGSELNLPNPDAYINCGGIITDTATFTTTPIPGFVALTFAGSTNSSDFPLVRAVNPNDPAPYTGNYDGTASNGGASDTFLCRMTPDLGRFPLSITITDLTALLSISIADLILAPAIISSPSDGATDQLIPTSLQWDPPLNAVTTTAQYAVYLSSIYTPQVEIYSGALTSYLPAPEQLEEGTPYYWQVVCVDDYYSAPVTFTRVSWSNLARFTTSGWRKEEDPFIPPTDEEVGGSSGDPYASKNQFTKGCFIATAVYGSPTNPNVVALRKFRDNYLLTNSLGGKFVSWYYKVSPCIAEHIKRSTSLAIIFKLALTPLVYSLRYPVPISIFLMILSLTGLLYWVSPRKGSIIGIFYWSKEPYFALRSSRRATKDGSNDN